MLFPNPPERTVGLKLAGCRKAPERPPERCSAHRDGAHTHSCMLVSSTNSYVNGPSSRGTSSPPNSGQGAPGWVGLQHGSHQPRWCTPPYSPGGSLLPLTTSTALFGMGTVGVIFHCSKRISCKKESEVPGSSMTTFTRCSLLSAWEMRSPF